MAMIRSRAAALFRLLYPVRAGSDFVPLQEAVPLQEDGYKLLEEEEPRRQDGVG
jgi:hypothetical protein